MNITQEHEGMKYCPKCEKYHKISDFAKNNREEDGRYYICRESVKKQVKKGRRSVKEGYYDVYADYGFLNQLNPTQGNAYVKEIVPPKRRK